MEPVELFLAIAPLAGLVAARIDKGFEGFAERGIDDFNAQ